MGKIVINKERCKGCMLCITFCPKGFIKPAQKLNKRGVRPVRFSRKANLIEGGIPPKAGEENPQCLGCSMCAIVCPDCCIEVYK